MSFEGNAGGPEAYFAAVCAAFNQSVQAAGGTIDRFFTIAGFRVRIRFAGPGLLSVVVPALSHLAAEPCSAPDLTVLAWDSQSTGIELPPFPWRIRDELIRGEVPVYSNQRFYTAYQPWAHMLNLLDTASDLAVLWVSRPDALPSFETAMPLRALLNWWLGEQERYLIHAAVVGADGGGVLLGGKSGAGKSTVAVACLSAGMSYASDDYIALSTSPEPVAHSLYSSAKLDTGSLVRFPDLAPAVINPEREKGEKAILFLHGLFPQRMAPSLPIRAILLPRITGGASSRIVRTSVGIALAALAPTSVLWLPHAGQRALQAIARLVERVPSYVLEIGIDITSAPGLISDLLASPLKGNVAARS